MIIATINDQPQTMSSREIAELTGKQHKHVRRDIEAMLETLELDGSKLGHIYKDASNRDQKEYLLNKELTLTLVTGYDVARRYKLVQRWQELEETVQRGPSTEIDYSDPRIVAKVLEAQNQKVLALSNQVNEMAPAQRALDELSSIEQSMTITEAAKAIGAAPKELFAFMRDRSNSWLYKKRIDGRDYGDDIAFQQRLDNGDLETKIVSYSGGTKHKTQVRVTSKGVVALAKKFVEAHVTKKLKKAAK